MHDPDNVKRLQINKEYWSKRLSTKRKNGRGAVPSDSQSENRPPRGRFKFRPKPKINKEYWSKRLSTKTKNNQRTNSSDSQSENRPPRRRYKFPAKPKIQSAPGSDKALYDSAASYLKNRKVPLGGGERSAANLVRTLVVNDETRKFVRKSLHNHAEQLAYVMAVYLYVRRQKNSKELIDAFAERTAMPRRKNENDIAIVSRCIIRYGSAAEPNSDAYRRLWHEDAKVIRSLIDLGVTVECAAAKIIESGPRALIRGNQASQRAGVSEHGDGHHPGTPTAKSGLRSNDTKGQGRSEAKSSLNGALMSAKAKKEDIIVVALRFQQQRPLKVDVLGIVNVGRRSSVADWEPWQLLTASTRT